MDVIIAVILAESEPDTAMSASPRTITGRRVNLVLTSRPVSMD
jgi:hypothetical protein